eukprot:6408795-Heterocapsa_arctica.AAC.1
MFSILGILRTRSANLVHGGLAVVHHPFPPLQEDCLAASSRVITRRAIPRGGTKYSMSPFVHQGVHSRAPTCGAKYAVARKRRHAGPLVRPAAFFPVP